MTADEGQRKLAAILAADVAGYSRLMADDERATVRTLTAYRSVFSEQVAAHHGRIVDTAGDSVLAVFDSVVEAVEAAVEIQRQLAARNEELPDHRRMRFRIGVNLGDIIVRDDGTVYGDGVNVAARLEALAEPGGIMVSEAAQLHLRNKVGVGLQDAGTHDVKNIVEPVRAYRVTADGETAPTTGSSRRSSVIWVGAAVAVVAVVGIAVWQIMDPPDQAETAVVSANPILDMPTGPSVAVLPLENLSSDPEQEYFADGLTEDIITELARFPDLRVLSRNTTFQYKGQAVDVQKVGADIGARYVIEGSVQRGDDRVRVTVQLIDAASGSHLWADRFDREFTEVFALQDEIATDVVGTITGGRGGVLQRAERKQSRAKAPKDLLAYDYLLQARVNTTFSRDEHEQRKALLQKAIELDPNYARAREEYAWLLLAGWVFRHDNAATPPDELKENAIRAVELAPSDPLAHRTAAYGYFFDGQLDGFRRHIERALDLAPHNAEILVEAGMGYSFIGDTERGLKLADKAHDLNPISAAGWYHSAWFYPLYLQGKYEGAMEMTRAHPLQELAETQMKYVMVYGRMGERALAMAHWQNCMDLEPDWSVQRMIDIFRLWNFPEDHIARFMMGVHDAGIGQSGQETSRPVVAVLPFDNMSGDPEQDYFANGLADDIIARIGQFKEIGVIARTSSFQYMNSAVDVRNVGTALGADYVLEGSVRRGGDSIRVTTQLTDASDGTRVWGEAYERPLSVGNIFEIQDQITTHVSGVVADRYGIVQRASMRRIGDAPAERLSSYECILKASQYTFDGTHDTYVTARDCLARVTAEEPDYADAWAARSEIYSDGVTVWADPSTSLDDSITYANKAIRIDAEHPHAHWALSYAYFAKGDYDQFRIQADRAIALDPSNSNVVGQLAAFIAALGDWDRGIDLLERSIQLNPNFQPWLNYAFISHYIRREEYEVALRYARDYVARAPDFHLAQMHMIGTLGLLGRVEEAAPHVEKLLEIMPDFPERVHSVIEPWYFDEALIARMYDGLRKAGLEISDPPPG